MITGQTMHTPYENDIAVLGYEAVSAPRKLARQDALRALELVRHQRTGYLRAWAEYEALREAVRMLLDNGQGTPQYEFARKVAQEALEGKRA